MGFLGDGVCGIEPFLRIASEGFPMIRDSKIGFAKCAFAPLRVMAGIVREIEIALDALQRGQLRQV